MQKVFFQRSLPLGSRLNILKINSFLNFLKKFYLKIYKLNLIVYYLKNLSVTNFSKSKNHNDMLNFSLFFVQL
jgi:hypothetical protein